MEEQLFRTITTHRKSGNLQKAWDMGCPAVQESPSDGYLKGAFFWVCYDYLKQVQGAIKERAQQNNGNFSPNMSELERINFLLDWVIWLDIPLGGYEYRSLLLLFQKNMENLPKLVLLLVKHGTALFNEEDKHPYQNDKGESPSLMLKFARKMGKAWMEHEGVRQMDIDQLLVVFAQARSEAKDRLHLIWLDYDEAKCLIIAGRLEQARECVIPVLRKKQSETWAWGALAATYRKQDISAAITLFCKGLSCAHDEKFALPLLKGIAPLLAKNGQLAEASMCLQRAINCYESNGWKLKADLEKLSSESWFDSSVNLEELSSFLERKSQNALDYLHGPREEHMTVISNVHLSGKGFHVYRDRHHSYSVPIILYQSKQPPKPGSYVRLTIASEDESAIAAEPCAAESLADVDLEDGVLRVVEKGFGFVNDTFVPPYLIDEGFDGQFVKIFKVLDFDKTKNKHSWKAITLELLNV
jgi:tetratricopeptide (TPR) repeat protein